jgi:transcriptional regulator with XRE-family HTH domain
MFFWQGFLSVIYCLTNLATLDTISSMNEQRMTLGKFLQTARETKRLSLRAVEKAVGVSNAYLSQLEGGKIKQPSPSILHKLAELYEVSYSEIMGLAGYPMPNQATDETSQSRFSSRIGSVTPDEESALIEYLAFLRSRGQRKS